MMLLVALFAVAALVWIVPVVQYGRTIQMASVVLIMGTVFGPLFFAIDGPIQISLDRLLWVAMFGLLLIRWRGGELSIPSLNRMDFLIGGLVGWLLLSTITGGEAPDRGTPPMARWIFYMAMPLGMYAVARLSSIKESDLRWIHLSLLSVGLYLAVTAVLEVTGVHAIVFPHYIVDSKDWEFFGRGRGPLMNPSGNAIVMSIALTITALGVVHSTRRMKAFYAILTTVMLAGLYCTLTRSAWMGAIGAMAIVALVHSPRWVRVLGLASVILVGGAAVTGLKDDLLRMKRDKNLTSADAEKSVQLRPLLAIVAWEMFKDKPIAGHGFGHYFAHSEPYHSIRSYGIPLENARPYAQHNVFLAILVDAGLIGLMLFVGFLIMVSASAWQLARDVGRSVLARNTGLIWLGTFAAYFFNGMFQDTTIIPMVNMFLFFTAGLAVAVAKQGLETNRVEQHVARSHMHQAVPTN